MVRLLLGGDVMTGRGIDQIMPHPSSPELYEAEVRSARHYLERAEAASGPIPRGVAPGYVWGDALGEIDRQGPDARIVNLETAVTTSSRPMHKPILYRMHPTNLRCLIAARPDCCVLANNHVMDWGRDGLVDTCQHLAAVGLRSAGAGRDLESALAPAAIPLARGGRVLVFALGSRTSGIPHGWAAAAGWPGVAHIEELYGTVDEAVAGTARRVAALRRPGDIVVLSIHWGKNWGYEIPPWQRTLAHGLIDAAGVDVIHGHSSHHVKAIEIHSGKAILYGCGDLIDDYEGNQSERRLMFWAELAPLYFLDLDPSTGRLEALVMTPLRMRRFRLTRCGAEDAAWLVAMLERECRPLGAAVALREDGRLEVRST